MFQPVSLSSAETPDGSPSCAATRSVPPSAASASVIVIVIAPAIDGSSVSNSSTSTIRSFGTSFSKRPW